MRNISLGILIMRLSLGVLMLFHGVAKLKGVDGISSMLTSHGLPSILAYGVYVGEIMAPLLLIVGYRTRFAALIFVINCVVAMFLAHANDFWAFSAHGGWKLELLGLYTFGALALVFTGGGSYSLSKKSSWD